MATLTMDDLRAERERILAIARGHRAGRVRLFGSIVRGENGPASDVDFLVAFEPGASAVDQVALVRELRDLLGVEVEVVSEAGLLPRHESIVSDAVDL
ncbi:MAG TPA: nucleotidyltransferase domain-containing protein [Acidimicrobiales bacterium]|nr:nucleotidyltransferase domain-containing protein [Acidimicrobiales bacterium]